MDQALDAIAEIQRRARRSATGDPTALADDRAAHAQGLDRPEEVDGLHAEGTCGPTRCRWRGAQERGAPAQLEAWLRSYRPEELFDEDGRPAPELVGQAPTAARRMGANPHANGGLLLRDLALPDFRDYAVGVKRPAASDERGDPGNGRGCGTSSGDNPTTFRVVGPDETASNRLGAVFEVTDRAWARRTSTRTTTSRPDGRVMEILSEHICQGWLEGYLLTGRHGLFDCYEAFIHIIDSMFNQHAKWLKMTRRIPWRRPIASLNYLLTSHVWRQDHNGFSHQDPGFIDHVINKKSEVIRVYLPPDANTLLSVVDHCLRSRHYVNVIVAGKQPAADWLTGRGRAALRARHRHVGVGSNDDGANPMW